MKYLLKIQERISRSGVVLPIAQSGTDLTKPEYYAVRAQITSTDDTTLKSLNSVHSPDTVQKFIEILREGKKLTGREKQCFYYGEEEGNKRHAQKSITLENMLRRYGEEEGTKKWNSYCEFQSYKNTAAGKKELHGMTDEDFIEYNKTRATTLENQIKKYGEEEGTKRFNLYREKQAYTNTVEYFGEEKYKEVNKRKALTLENFCLKYGLDDGTEKYIDYVDNRGNYIGASKNSQEFCWYLYDTLPVDKRQKVYFQDLNKEYCIFDENRAYFLDFVCLDLGLCVEFHGDYYHANPTKYDETFILRMGNTVKTATEIWEADRAKKEMVERTRKLVYHVVWEHDWNSDPKTVLSEIRRKYVDCV